MDFTTIVRTIMEKFNKVKKLLATIAEKGVTPLVLTNETDDDIMWLKVVRFSENENSTLGLFYIDDQFMCYTLEDEFREKKVHGKTRIPGGTYEVKLRTEGGFHNRYTQRFPDIHKGMLHITNVPDFEWILIHVGNTDEDTAGCLLVGNTLDNNQVNRGFLGQSVPAYTKIYPIISKALLENKKVSITYYDPDFIETM